MAIFKLLLLKQADPFAVTKKGQGLIHMAAENDRAEMIAFLVSIGLDVNSADQEGRTPLHLAAHS